VEGEGRLRRAMTGRSLLLDERLAVRITDAAPATELFLVHNSPDRRVALRTEPRDVHNRSKARRTEPR